MAGPAPARAGVHGRLPKTPRNRRRTVATWEDLAKHQILQQRHNHVHSSFASRSNSLASRSNTRPSEKKPQATRPVDKRSRKQEPPRATAESVMERTHHMRSIRSAQAPGHGEPAPALERFKLSREQSGRFASGVTGTAAPVAHRVRVSFGRNKETSGTPEQRALGTNAPAARSRVDANAVHPKNRQLHYVAAASYVVAASCIDADRQRTRAT